MNDWKWIKMISNDIVYDYTDMYRIYRDGRVESVKRYRVKQRFLKEITHRDGYKQVGLSKNGKEKKYRIHRIIAIHFIPNPDNFPEVDHINQVKDDNSIQNLRWCSHSTNMRHITKRNKNLKWC